MVLTLRPAGSGSWNGPNDSGKAERLAVRRAVVPMIVERGLDDVTVDDIIAAAGISRRKFFRLFTGKNQVFSCDHEVYHLEVHTYLLQHQGERTLHRAAKGAALIVDALTAVPDDAKMREQILRRNPALLAEELLWYARYETTIAEFLTGVSAPSPPVPSVMTAAAIIAAVRASISSYTSGITPTAARAFADAINTYTNPSSANSQRIALVQTSLTMDELLERIQGD
ncbi:TetR/AcrR family transcriptional regulator [Arthrobacter sp. NPDC092385]|uniref:TetR/AcrR family transcriptional regulator n=1 Tax=Arthrobacter sp. NPDC092385 TaxID=3363943 RepID=UPI003808F0D7